MPGGKNDDWEREFSEDAPTQQVDVIPEAVPEPIRTSPDTTGKYRTLTGYEVSREIYEAQGEAVGIEKVMTALKLWQMSGGTHPIVAEVNVNKLRAWMNEPVNEELIRVAMKKG